MAWSRRISVAASVLLLAACSKPATQSGDKTDAATPVATISPAEAAQAQAAGLTPVSPPVQAASEDFTAPIEASSAPQARSIDETAWAEVPATPQAGRDAVIRVEVLLARAHFSPGVIDGRDGDNLKNAIEGFEAANAMPVTGRMSPQLWAKLSQDARPVLTDYTITPDDVKGPFIGKVPTDMSEMAKLPALGFTGPVQALAERFHMDEALLKSLNPGVDFGAAGQSIVVAALGPQALAMPVTRIEVDKTRRQLRAYGAAGLLLASYPATVGSAERPAPSGQWAVRTVAPDPTYTYDPSRLTFGKAAAGKLTIKPGPNNPVGSTWIDLTADTYGIHGTPDPRLVGKAASHGCVRLTNWDARQLGKAVKKGATVVFLGEEPTRSAQAKTLPSA